MMELYLRGRKGDALPVRGGRARIANTVRSFLQQESAWVAREDGEQRFRLRFDVASIPATETLAAAELRLSVQRHSNSSHNHPPLRILVHEVIRPGKRNSPPILRLLDTRVLTSRRNRESKIRKGVSILHENRKSNEEKHEEENTEKDVRWRENLEVNEEDKENEVHGEDGTSSHKDVSHKNHVLNHAKKSTRLKKLMDDTVEEDEVEVEDEGKEGESRRNNLDVGDEEELEEEDEDRNQRHRKLSQREEDGEVEEMVVEFDVLPAVQRWRERKGTNHGLVVEVLWPSRASPPSSSAPRVRVRRDTSEPHSEWLRSQPLLLAFTDDGRNSAAPRAQNRDSHHGRSSGGYDEDKNAGRGARGRRKRGSGHRFRPTSKDTCRRRDLYVNFADVGWSDWIVAPQGYDAFFCAGECPFPLPAHMNTTNHAVVQTLVHSVHPHAAPRPCCVPTQLSSISLLFLDDNDKVVLKNYQDMAVIGCGCR